MKIGVGGGGWVEEAVRSCMEEDENWVEGNCGNLNLSIGLDLGNHHDEGVGLKQNLSLISFVSNKS